MRSRHSSNLIPLISYRSGNKDDEIQDMKDKFTIAKGDYIKATKAMKEEWQAKVNDLSQKLKEETEKNSGYKKYTGTELKLLKSINDRLKNYINVLKKELVLGNFILMVWIIFSSPKSLIFSKIMLSKTSRN